MFLIRNDSITEDGWTAVTDDEALPADRPAIVSLARWRTERGPLLARGQALGVRLTGDQGPEEIAGDVGHFSVIALEFAAFTDGRAYSHARLLRERFGYKGELRAVGEVLRDQYLFMVRAGFDVIEVADESALEGWRQALAEFTVWYQPTGDGRTTATTLRHGSV